MGRVWTFTGVPAKKRGNSLNVNMLRKGKAFAWQPKREESRFSPLGSPHRVWSAGIAGTYTKFLLLSLFCLLTACTHTHKKDGPPNFYVDISKIPNATPKAEKKSKYGNMASYVARGKRYYTLKSSKHFEEVGIASWYGTLFHKRRTSSGEPYNMLGMTAAHRSLPLPTYVEVTNLKNNRKIIVKVNDRGPFASNRIIDLSYVAAKKLGMAGRGTAPVKIKAINPTAEQRALIVAKQKPRQTNRNLYSTDNQYVYLRVNAYSNSTRAARLHHRIRSLLAERVSISPPERTTAGYQIKVGPIHNKATAVKIRQQLLRLGINPTLVTL